MARSLAWLLALMVMGYIALCAWMFVRQRQLVYFPQFTRVDAAETDFSLRRGDGIILRGWAVNPGQPRAIVYFGGNGEQVGANRYLFAHALTGYSVYLVAYRGYGASDGAPSQPALLGDALALFDHAQQAHPAAPVAVIGRSLGSGVASHVAARRQIDRLALVTPFDSLGAVAQAHYPWLPARWLMRERYESAAWLRAYRGPLLIVRAGRDEVVPPANTGRLIASLPRPPRVVPLAGSGHNTLDHEAYARALATFFASP